MHAAKPHPLSDDSLSRRRLLGSACALALAGCGALVTPTSWTVPEADLQRLMARDFPQHRRVLEIVDVDIGLPALTLLPASNRLATVTPISVRERLLGGHWHGILGVEAGLRWRPDDASVRLADVRMTALEPSDGSALPPHARAIATALAELMLRDRALYRVPVERLARLRERGVEPVSLDVTDEGLTIRLKPVGASR